MVKGGKARPNVEEFVLEDGRRIGCWPRDVSSTWARREGHPAQVMDMSFANQALSAAWLSEMKAGSNQGVSVPEAIDTEVARRKLEPHGREFEQLSRATRLLHSWRFGT